MVECGGLENRWWRKLPGGSNPSLSANKSWIIPGLLFLGDFVWRELRGQVQGDGWSTRCQQVGETAYYDGLVSAGRAKDYHLLTQELRQGFYAREFPLGKGPKLTEDGWPGLVAQAQKKLLIDEKH